MPRYLDPKNDLTFKRIFGEHPDLLIGFLIAVMPLSPDRLIKEVEYLPPEQVPENPGKKNSIVDVKCKDKSGQVFIIEMQMFLKEVGEKMKSLPEELAENEQIRKAAELCEEAAFTPEELAAYEAYWDLIRTEKTIREGSLAKGEAIGLEKVIINGHKAGMTIETISIFTGLTIGQINEILEKNGLL